MSAPNRISIRMPAACAWLFGVGGYTLAYFAGLSRLYYLPVEGRFALTVPEGAVAMSWYGLLLWGLLFTVVGWFVGARLDGAESEASNRTRVVSRLAIVTSIASLAAFLAYELWRWTR